MFGSGYVIDHCIAVFQKKQEERAFRTYLTDALRLVTENTAKNVGGGYLVNRYDELIHPKKEDPRSAEEIAADIIKKIGLEVL